jgi:hypothetical protein
MFRCQATDDRSAWTVVVPRVPVAGDLIVLNPRASLDDRRTLKVLRVILCDHREDQATWAAWLDVEALPTGHRL